MEIEDREVLLSDIVRYDELTGNPYISLFLCLTEKNKQGIIKNALSLGIKGFDAAELTARAVDKGYLLEDWQVEIEAVKMEEGRNFLRYKAFNSVNPNCRSIQFHTECLHLCDVEREQFLVCRKINELD